MRKNKIFRKFISHELIIDKYGINKVDIPNNITQALASEIPIIKTIATLVEELENNPGINNVALYNKINIYLTQNI
ncbi:hypothetical protein LNI90_00435 [Tenacibaculum dicentrarchi]|uniref:hypothetical protein n=1 Tax=Tenacibaculum dicentrarchi TaxID=669041 RepID=UPI000C7CF182|nr:hypothetical protein [Tenacibaculum dicentrarchi]MCD8450556.1 hypothetical protein [Tenacibaculum dicentrarchi]MCG8828202.1 hypothetical protein [Tenacibaculum dicentrarchi]SOU87636.1 conserved hypothetical protein [Tenacibaculum dicentrarchi]